MIHRLIKRLLPILERFERPAAWGLMIAGLITFIGVVIGLFTVGEAKLATLLISADLFVSGFSAVQEAEDDEES